MSVKTDNFINKIAPLAVEDMKKTGVLASLTIAQAILESGWGQSTLAKQHNNLFGIKANSTWNGESVSLRGSNWRAYGSWDESILDHSKLLQGTRYTKVLKAKDYKEACEEVRLAGYCTEGDYSQKLIKLIEQYDLAKYDTKTTETASVVSEQDGIYRVRLIWKDSKTQVGAYKNLKNAQKKCDEHLGYSVFDSNGNIVYENKEFKPYLVKIISENVPVYRDANIDKQTMYVHKGEVFTIVEEKDGFLKLKSGVGWLFDSKELLIRH